MAKRKHRWNDDQPIYRQITDTIIGRILDGTYPEGDLLPSVRQCAEEFDVSPLTAAKVFQELDKEKLTIKHRGIGAEVSPGSRTGLLKREREKFMNTEWPEVLGRMQQLGISLKDLKS
jgi:GntR family transcriptional regulator